MRDSEPRPQRRAVAAIEQKQLVGVSVMQRVGDAAAQIFACPGGAQPFALDAEECELVERIDHAQAGVEFQAIDDAHRIAEPNVFGAQIAMTVDDAARSHPRGDERAALGQETPLHSVAMAHRSCRQVEARVEQDTLVISETLPQRGPVFLR